MNELINPGVSVSKVVLTKDFASTFSGFGIKCELFFSDGKSIIHDIECAEEIFEEKYPRGIYEWTGKEFIQIENWDL